MMQSKNTERKRRKKKEKTNIILHQVEQIFGSLQSVCSTSFIIVYISAFLRPVQTGNVWRPNIIKHCLVTKHADVEVNGQTVKTCLIKHR